MYWKLVGYWKGIKYTYEFNKDGKVYICKWDSKRDIGICRIFDKDGNETDIEVWFKGVLVGGWNRDNGVWNKRELEVLLNGKRN